LKPKRSLFPWQQLQDKKNLFYQTEASSVTFLLIHLEGADDTTPAKAFNIQGNRTGEYDSPVCVERDQ
jgi:hypothetical protein